MIIGAGLVGALLAVGLAQRGCKVVVYERYHDIRAIPSMGRSINLVLTSRGLRAVSGINKELAESMLDLSVRVLGRGLHAPDGKASFQRYGKDDSEYNNSISRYDLNVFLIDAAEKAGAKILFDYKVDSLDIFKNVIHMATGGSDKPVSKHAVSFDHLFACDGAGSAVRYALRDAGHCDFSEEFITHGYKEIMFPREPAKGVEKLNPNQLHIWPRHTHFLMALADKPLTFTGTIYLPKTGPKSFAELNNQPEKVRAFLREYYSDVFPLMGENGEDEFVKQFLKNPSASLGSVRCHKFNLEDKVLLLGDAAHAMVPFFGQGCNAGFEDVSEFIRMLDQSGNRMDEKLFDRFDRVRRPNTWALQNMALENFVEMCSRVAEGDFQQMKGIEEILEKKCPELYRSRYAMVCYGGAGNISYKNAFSLGSVQADILRELAKGLKSPEDLDIEHAKKVLREKLLPLQRKLKVDLSTVNHEYWHQDPPLPRL